MAYCCHVLGGSPSCYLGMIDKLQKRAYRTVGPTFAASLEALGPRKNVAGLRLFYRYCYGRFSSELADRFQFFVLVGDPLVILRVCMSFLSPFLDVTRMSISTVSFLAQLDSGILCLQNAFP